MNTKPVVARIVVEVLMNGVESLPIDAIVEGLSEDGVRVLTATVEEIKGKALKGKLLKAATEAMEDAVEDNDDDDEPDA
jgi:hypothetical protein